MLLQVMSVRDAKTTVFSQPMFFVTKGVAIRSFHDEVNRIGSDIQKHAEDYSMWFLGVFDDQSSCFTQNNAPEQIALAIDALKA